MQYTKHTFFKEIFLFVLAAHCLLLMLVLFFDKGNFEQEKFVINTSALGSTVVFMPLHKRVPQQSKQSVSDASSKSRNVMNYETYQKEVDRRKKSKKDGNKQVKKSPKKVVKPELKTSKPVEIKPVAKKDVVKSPTTLHHEQPKSKVVQPVEQPKVEKKIGAKEKLISAKIMADKKAADKNLAEKLKEQEALVPVKQDLKLEEVKAAKAVEHVKTEVEEKKEQQVVAKEALSAVVEEESLLEAEDDLIEDETGLEINLDNVSFVGRHDLEKYEITEMIKKEITKYWKPPVGIAKTAVCELAILVGVDGKAIRVTIKKGSGILAYDISGRAAAYQSHFPKEVYGQEFIIVLGS